MGKGLKEIPLEGFCQKTGKASIPEFFKGFVVSIKMVDDKPNKQKSKVSAHGMYSCRMHTLLVAPAQISKPVGKTNGEEKLRHDGIRKTTVGMPMTQIWQMLADEQKTSQKVHK